MLSCHCESVCNTHGSGPSTGPRRFQMIENILVFYLGLSKSDERKHWGGAMACCHIRYRCLRATFFVFTRATVDSDVSNAKRKVNTLTPCSQTRGKLHDSGTREYPTNRTPVLSVYKMVADLPPDVTSPTFLTYFSLHASGPLPTDDINLYTRELMLMGLL